MRISRADMFLRVAEIIAERGTCPRAQVGAVIVRDGRIISMGYNGAPKGLPHCEDVGCVIGTNGGCERAVHAEMNAVMWAAREGISTDMATMYCTYSPCVYCAVAIVACGIQAFCYLHNYRDDAGLKILNDHLVMTRKWSIGAGSVADTEGAKSHAASRDRGSHHDGGGI